VKLEVKSYRTVTVNAGAKWMFFKDKLELYETVPWQFYEHNSLGVPTHLTISRPKPSLQPGDNIRLDGEPYHIEKLSVVVHEEKRRVLNYHFIYKLERGFWKPPEWIQIAEVKEASESG